METFVDIISDIGAQISKIKRCRINQQTLNKPLDFSQNTRRMLYLSFQSKASAIFLYSFIIYDLFFVLALPGTFVSLA